MDGQAHYLRPAGKTYTPSAVIFADTETRQHMDGQTEVHTLRCWEAQWVIRRDRRRAGHTDTQAGLDAVAFAALIDTWASYPESTWLYTHNVTFDLTVTGLASHLGQLGWKLSSRFAVGGDAMWCVFHKGGKESARNDRLGPDGKPATRVKWAHTLTIADSASLFPGPLAQLGPHVGVDKPPLPDEDDSAEAWAARCHADTEILKRSVLTMLDWWDAADMGHWTVTGPGQAWQSYKRTLDPRKVVIDHAPDILAIERAAVYGGRRDVFKVGPLPAGRYGEIDYEGAYPAIAAELPLPARAACPVNDDHRRQALRGHVPAGMLAEVTINATAPRWPCRVGGRVFYPVGRFRTTLAAPDIQAAADAHCLEAVHEGWLFTLSYHLRPWAKMVLGWIRDKTGAIPGVVRIWAKAASRFVIGKFGQRGWRTEPYVGPPGDGWSVEQTIDYWTGVRGVITGVNGDFFLSWADQRGEHERPAVLAFVESHTRMRLGRVIASRWGAGIMQCDTDGVMVSHDQLQQLAAGLGPVWMHGRQVPAGTAEVIEQWNELSWPLRMREKTQFTKAVVMGPQQVILDGKLRAAGVPRGAWKTSDTSYLARLWPGIVWQAQHGPPGAYARPLQPYTVAGPYAAAWVLADGSVRAAETDTDEQGRTALLHWKQTRWAASGDRLGPRQAAWAEGLWEGEPISG